LNKILVAGVLISLKDSNYFDPYGQNEKLIDRHLSMVMSREATDSSIILSRMATADLASIRATCLPPL
jgi:hypothetical protein